MKKIVPALLKKGDEVRIIAPSRGVKIIGKDVRALAEKRLNELGLKVSYAENAVDENWDELGTTSVQKRVDDIMNAFKDKNVKAIMTMIGGFNSNQILPYLDYEVIKANPKILCGFSDITALLDAIYAKTGLITFSGPHFSSLGMLKGCDYTITNMVKMLMEKGEKTAIISRGYGGKLSNKNINVISDGKTTFYEAEMAGDEPFWLAQNTKAVVITSKNRVKASEFAIKNYGVTKIILDDGFQHRKLHRDLDIVLMDSEKGFGNENLLPAGPLREGTEAFSRVDKLVIVSKNTDHSRAEKLAKIMGKKLKLKTLVAKAEPDIVYNIKTGEELLKGTKAYAICAIGQPEQFYAFLKDYDIVSTITFDDHHRYTEEEISKINGDIITTEKDAVKLKTFGFDNIYALRLKTVIDCEELLHG